MSHCEQKRDCCRRDTVRVETVMYFFKLLTDQTKQKTRPVLFTVAVTSFFSPTVNYEILKTYKYSKVTVM